MVQYLRCLLVPRVPTDSGGTSFSYCTIFTKVSSTLLVSSQLDNLVISVDQQVAFEQKLKLQMISQEKEKNEAAKAAGRQSPQKQEFENELPEELPEAELSLLVIELSFYVVTFVHIIFSLSRIQMFLKFIQSSAIQLLVPATTPSGNMFSGNSYLQVVHITM